MENGQLIALTVIYAGAATVQGVVGFGFALISVPLVAVMYGPGAAVAMNAVVGTANCGYKAWLLRREIDRRAVLRFFAGTLVFVPVGVVVISVLDREPALAAIGTFVVAVAVGNLISRDRVHRAAARPVAFWGLAGASGVLSGAFAAPGPAAVPYFTARTPRPLTAKANLQLYFLLSAGPGGILHTIAGTVTPAALTRAVWYLPVVFAATWGGTKLSERLPADNLRRIIDGALLALGLWLLWDNLLAPHLLAPNLHIAHGAETRAALLQLTERTHV